MWSKVTKIVILVNKRGVRNRMQFGNKIRKLRLSLGLTQEDVAARADLARSFISQVETDKTSPTLENMERILKAVGSDLTSFFSEKKMPKIVYSQEERVPVYDEPTGITSQMLMNEVENKGIDAILVSLEPGAETELEDFHEGDEFGYLIDGTITLYLDEKQYKVQQGDCFYYKADKQHKIKNNEKKAKAKLLWIKID
jgi:transcriptional regulator with XRE-family HTH domain